MRILVLGGSVFLSKAVAADAVSRGHDVTCVTRGRSGEVPDGTRHVVWDRADDVPADLAAEDFDAVVDVSRIPSHVRKAVAAWPGCALGVRVDDQRVRRQRDARPRHRRPARRGHRRGPRPARGPRGLRPDEGLLRERRDRRRRAVDGGPARADRRPGRPDRPLRLLAGAAGRRRPGARARRTRRTACSSSTCATSRSGSCAASRTARPASTTASGRRRLRATCSRRRPRASAPAPELVWTGQDFLAEQKVEPWMGDGGAAAVAAAAGVRRDDHPPLRPLRRRGPHRAAVRRHRPRHPRLAARTTPTPHAPA